MKKGLFALLGLVALGGLLLLASGLRSAQVSVQKAPNPAGSDQVVTGGAAIVDSKEPENQTAAQGETQGVDISPDRQWLVGIKTVEVTEQPLRKTIRTIGRVEVDERKLTTVNIKVEGWIETLHADYTGKYVKKGEPLAEVYSPELTSLQFEYLNILKWKKDAQYRFQRNIEFEWGDRYGTTGKMQTYDQEAVISVAKQKFKLWGFTDNDIAELEKAGAPPKTVTVKSPANGYVIQKPGVKGTRVGPGDKLFDIADLSSVWVIADVYQYELPFVKPGQTAQISLNNQGGGVIASKVDFVYPFLSGQTRSAKVRFVLPNRGLTLKPQMFANVEIAADLGKRLSVPRDAVLDNGRRQVVYVDEGNGYFVPRAVQLGVRADESVEVVHGLKAGDRVAASAVFLIDSEVKLKGIQR
jgi:membrane fusion protein, copper/silver efflux system